MSTNQIKRGLAATIPVAADGELLWTTDTHKLLCGQSGTNYQIGGTGDALTTNPLSQFAATTSLQLKNTISDETGSGALVFATSPVLTTPNIGAATGSITGNSGTATALATPRNINGVAFDGTTNITVATDANTLTGTTLNATIVTSSLTTVGTINTGTWQGTTVAINKGGTGQVTANAALNALLPSQSGASGKVLQSDGVNTSFATPGAAAAGSLTGSTLASGVVTSSLTQVGTLTGGTWNATTIAIAKGGTGQTTANAALNALLPAQSGAGKVLTSDGTNTSFASPALFPKTLFNHVDPRVANGAAAAETTLYSDTMAAGQMATDGDRIEAMYAGMMTLHATATKRFKFHFGANVLYDSGTFTNGTAYLWRMYVTLARMTSVNLGPHHCKFDIVLQVGSIAPSFNPVLSHSAATLFGVDFSGAYALKITGTSSNGGTDQIVAEMGSVKYWPV